MEIVLVKTDQLAKIIARYNPRKISDHDMASLRKSLQTFGCVEPVVVNRRTNTVVGGHQRVKAAGPGFRPMDLAWPRAMREKCAASKVAFFFKQSAAYRTEMGTILDGESIKEYPVPRVAVSPLRLV